MKKRYGLFIIISIFLLAGLGVNLVNRYYSFDYLYNLLLGRNTAINPRAELKPDENYLVEIWYQPFLRMIDTGQSVEGNQEEGAAGEKDFFQQVYNNLHQAYPNIRLKITRLSFSKALQQLEKALEDGKPPDIYLNFSNYELLDPRRQVPVEPYLTAEEKKGFYTVDWNKISGDHHLWGWPFLVRRQVWIANSPLPQFEGQDGTFLQRVNQLDRGTMVLNYADPVLLLQLLSLQGLQEISMEKGQLSQEAREKILEVLELLHKLNKKQVFALSTFNMDDNWLRLLYTHQPLLAGPVNPWLEVFLAGQQEIGSRRIPLDNLFRVMTLSIFRQQDYQGDDHTRAVMETARIMVEQNADQLAGRLALEKAYNKVPTGEIQQVGRQLPEIPPDVRQYWQEVVEPVWLSFWREGLTPVEVMNRLKSYQQK